MFPFIHKQIESSRTGIFWWWLAIGYGLLICYTSLFPFNWHPPVHWLDPLAQSWPHHDPLSDIAVNLCAYIPLGFLIGYFGQFRGRVWAVFAGVGGGFLLSFSMEFLQQAIPSRVSSIEDVAHNTLGALIGALLTLIFTPRGRSRQWFFGLWQYFFAPGRIVNVALLSLSFWLAAELFPYALSLDMSTIKAALHPLVYELRNPTDFDVWKMLIEAGGLTIAGMLLRVSMGKAFFLAWSTLLVGVSLLKVIVVWQVISPEYFVGAFAAWLLLALPGESSRRAQALGGLLAAITYLVLQSLRRGFPVQLHVFNWIPFAEQIDALPRIVGLLETLWIALAMVVFTRLLTDNSRMMRWLRWLGGFLLFCGWFWLEWHKQVLPGRYGDITDPLVGLAVWVMGWGVLRSSQPAVENQDLATGADSFPPTQKQG